MNGIFYFVVFRRRAGLAIPPIVSGYFSRHFPYSISSRISQGPVQQRCVEEGRGEGGGGGREDNTNMEAYVGILRERRYPEQFFIYSYLKTCIKSVT